jgi:hypothetical protein
MLGMLAGWSFEERGDEPTARGGSSLVFDPHLRALVSGRTVGHSCPRQGIDTLEELRPQKEMVWCREVQEDGRC